MTSRKQDQSLQQNEAFPQLSRVFTETNSRISAMQLAAMNEAFALQSRQLQSMLQGAAEASRLMAEWNRVIQTRAEKFGELAHVCLEFSSQTVIEMHQLMGNLAAVSPKQATSSITEKNPLPYLEKRFRSAAAMPFPDRRLPASMRRLAGGESNSMQRTYN